MTKHSMRSLFMFTALALFAIGAQAGANCNGKDNCNEYNDDHSTSNKAYGGSGGDANVGNGFGNFSPSAKAYGGDASDVYNKNIGVNGQKQGQDQDQKQGQIQGQDQGQYQKANAHQGQGQIGIVANNGPQVVIEDNKTITYEASSAPAIAADVNAPAPTAGCRYSQGFSIAGSVIAGSGSVGHSTSEYDAICGAWQAAGQTEGNAKIVATTVAYCMTMDEAGIEVAQCDDWKGKVARGLGEDGTWVSAPANVAQAPVVETLAFSGINGSEGR